MKVIQQFFVIAAIAVAVFMLAALFSGCTDRNGAADALRKAGYTQIETGGYAMWSCSDDDTYATKFKAVGPSGVRVSGAVCSAWLKGKTIRLD